MVCARATRSKRNGPGGDRFCDFRVWVRKISGPTTVAMPVEPDVVEWAHGDVKLGRIEQMRSKLHQNLA